MNLMNLMSSETLKQVAGLDGYLSTDLSESLMVCILTSFWSLNPYPRLIWLFLKLSCSQIIFASEGEESDESRIIYTLYEVPGA